MSSRQQRLRAANLALTILAREGPPALYRVAAPSAGRLGLDRAGQVWYVDGFTGLMLYPFGTGRWVGFSGAPELQAVVAALAELVRDGALVDLVLIRLLVEQSCAAAYGDAWPDVNAELVALDAHVNNKK